jgi:hypothetical protein
MNEITWKSIWLTDLAVSHRLVVCGKVDKHHAVVERLKPLIGQHTLFRAYYLQHDLTPMDADFDNLEDAKNHIIQKLIERQMS